MPPGDGDVGGAVPSLFFRHSQLTTVGVLGASLSALLYDQYHIIYEKYHITKKWLNLCGMLCLFVWLYLRPLIRRRLGSASGGYINWNSMYVLWLMAAFIYHLPSLESMGFDIKADISMLLSSFLLSGAVLGGLSALCSAAVSLGWISPRLLRHTGTMGQLFSTIILNSFNLAVVSSTYYSFCGNGDVVSTDMMMNAPQSGSIRDLVCGRWLHPLPSNRHPAFARWVIYVESVPLNVSVEIDALQFQNDSSRLTEDRVIDVRSNLSRKGQGIAADSISPVFTAWITILSMMCINWASDYAASVVFSSAYSHETRRLLLHSHRRSSRSLLSRKSFESKKSHDKRNGGLEIEFTGQDSLGRVDSLTSILTRTAAGTGAAAPLKVLLRTVSSVGSLLGKRTSFELTPPGMGHAYHQNVEGDGRSREAGFERSDGAAAILHGDSASKGGERPNIDENLQSDLKSYGHGSQPFVGVVLHPESPAPSFLPMFPWYSGTSADLLKTLFDLMVSVKLFLGRFDMRTMQAATAGLLASGGSGDTPPRDGDGFTFEHLSERDEAWIDFVGDTGDGGNPTYSIARCMAAREVVVELPSEHEEDPSSPSTPTNESRKVKVLPRADILIHGGDLAYPNPTDETYEQRLWSPYEDAFPPPPHVHPGHLVVNKPDLPPEYWDLKVKDQSTACSCSLCGRVLGEAKDCGKPSTAFDVTTGLEIGANGPGLCRRCAKSAALAGYEGPCAFLVPGNHDWIDGLETFQRHVIHKGWLGGWLLPQEKSYFALHLPHGWWVLTIDLGLDNDIDMLQFSYFARIAEERMLPEDTAILVTHTPEWLTSWFWGKTCGKNLRKLVRGPLKGRARLHLAGDLHFYMRHSFKPYRKRSAVGDSSMGIPSGISPPASEISTPGGMSPPSGSSPTVSRCSTPQPFTGFPASGHFHHQNLVNRLHGLSRQQQRIIHSSTSHANVSAGSATTDAMPSSRFVTSPGGSSPTLSRVPSLQGWSEDECGMNCDIGSTRDAKGSTSMQALSRASDDSESTLVKDKTTPDPLSPTFVGNRRHSSSPPQTWWSNLRMPSPLLGSSPTGSASDITLGRKASHGKPTNPDEWEGPPPGWQLNEPEHLVVCGIGGAFLHPTHVFSYSRFRPVHDPAAGPIFVTPETSNLNIPVSSWDKARSKAPSNIARVRSSSSLYSLPRWQAPRPAGGEFRCAASFPSSEASLKLGRRNLYTFRNINSRFDIVGGAFYYLLVVSVLPRCSGISNVLDAHSVAEALTAFASAALDTVAEIFTRSYISLGAFVFLFIIVLGFARSGGVGAISGVPAVQRRLPEYYGFALAVKARLGGVAAQVTYAGLHALAHFSAAVSLLLLLELGIEMILRAHVGDQGYHSLFRWYQEFEAVHFPDPAGLRSTLSSWTMGLYPSGLKWLMAFFDVPEAIVVARTTVCAENGSIDDLNRLQTIGLYGGYLLYFWMLATPTVGLLFGLYLYISVNWLHLHYDEAFSALQTEHFKGFLRFHVRKDGAIECFSLGLSKVPQSWREDPRWRGPAGGGLSSNEPSHRVRWPSRWIPVEEHPGIYGRKATIRTDVPPECQLKVIDHFVVHKHGNG